MRTLAITLAALAFAGLAQAQTRYVSDRLEVPVRAGTSTGYKILRMLESGTPVQVLRRDGASGYTRVRAGGVEGWILSRYLMSTPHARASLEAAREEAARLSAENAELKARLERIAGEKGEVETQATRATEQNERLSKELAQIRETAANTIAIDRQNRTLQEQVVSLEHRLQRVQQANQSLADRSTRDWFVAGAGVVVLGIGLGLILPRLRIRKRNRWGDL